MDNDKQTEHTQEEPAPSTKQHIRWAPLHGIPLERRLQMLATCIWIALLPICLGVFLLCFLFPVLWPLLIAYIAFLFFDQAPENGGRRFDWPRRWLLWRYFAAYFPVKLIKEHDLDPTQNYVFGYHPHGIISMGAFINFGTEATGFSELFPGIVPSLLTLASNFRLPIYRDIIMALGISSVSRHSCDAILSSGPGRSIIIVIGGAAESLNARPGINELTLKRRLGFIRLAIKHQAPLVPVFSFGENDLYEQVDNAKGSTVWKVQKKMQSLLGFTLPLFHARGIFNYDVGLVPFRHEIATVVGKPIPVPKLEKDQTEPTQEQLLALQDEYIKELETIYHKYKDIYAKDRKEELKIVD
ncbi:diacylglycerol O-acyltransferase 1 [Apophysomyces ossiformis]|uniref:Diacylglycerol O-acyltransferase n=1 Tax=Apophysomyces ossiformis TaxID=679940 RepID=A0A8H7BRZ9_9FUNG|nr:diacylglycerol O-acyltransferase 1 [Apophysomyces ossiformis]